MLTKWKIIAALGLAAAGAVASGIAVLLQKLPPEDAAPAGEPQAKPKNLVTGSYSFISGFQDAATVEVCLDYDPEAFSFVVVEDEFLNYSSASHAAIVCGRDFNLQLEYAGYYNGEDFAAHKAALAEKYRTHGNFACGDLAGIWVQDGDNILIHLPIPDDQYSYLLIVLVQNAVTAISYSFAEIINIFAGNVPHTVHSRLLTMLRPACRNRKCKFAHHSQRPG
jgi:hypothetical protein